METRVKERLTGAVILVALMVLLVPELLSGPHSTQQAATRAADAPPERSFTVDLTDGLHKGSAAAPQPEATEPVPAATKAPQPVADGAAAPLGAAVTAAAATAAAASVTRAATSHAAPGPGAATVHGRARAQSTAVSSWAIQVGSFTSRENAEHLASELRARNFIASVSESTTNGRKLYRVRVGPEPDRASAQALAARLHAAGHSGSIVPSP